MLLKKRCDFRSKLVDKTHTAIAPPPSASSSASPRDPKAFRNASRGVSHASLPRGSELTSPVTGAQSARVSPPKECPPYGRIFRSSEWFCSHPLLVRAVRKIASAISMWRAALAVSSHSSVT